ncbi:MAG TPA: response regulator [Gemmatimonadales bacterium]|jgi:twitching motility two-component system response regulator PilH|nr:response regulator [Gemmatimonadales bacterium]
MSRLVLIIDDDVIERELLQRCLAMAGYRVLTAPGGADGVTLAREHSPDLVILDVVMPGMNGYQTCRQLRALPETSATPVLMLTSKDQAADRFWADEVGVSAYLTKPIDVTELLGTARGLLSAP